MDIHQQNLALICLNMSCNSALLISFNLWNLKPEDKGKRQILFDIKYLISIPFTSFLIF